jgi:hypothetical protein
MKRARVAIITVLFLLTLPSCDSSHATVASERAVREFHRKLDATDFARIYSDTHVVFKLWIYDLRTNLHFTLKENPLKRADLDDFVACYSAKDRTKRKESERWKAFTYEELTKRDKVNLDIFWLKDESLEDSANLPDPHTLALEIAEDLEAALEQFATIAEDLKR